MHDLTTVIIGLIRAPLFLLLHLYVRVHLAWHNRRSKASDPGLVRLSHSRLKRLCPEYFATWFDPLGWFDQIAGLRAIQIYAVADQLIHGDSRAAVVMSVSPLLVAAYTDELYCVAMLRFPDDFVREFGLQVRSRLLTVNRYRLGGQLAKDLQNGRLSHNRYVNFQPFIADFLSDDIDRIRLRKSRIREDEWARAWVFGQQYLARFGDCARDGSPESCVEPAQVPESLTAG